MHLNINIDPMAAERYVSLKVVADQLHRNPLMNGIAFEAILDYTVDFLQIVGVPADFIDKYYSIEYKDYRAPLPEDYVECNQLMIDNRVARWATDTFHNLYSDTKTTGNYYINDKLPRSVDYTFTINNSYIYLSKEKGKIEMSYKAIPVDEDGYPMIPDNPVFQRALRMFIEKEHARILYLMINWMVINSARLSKTTGGQLVNGRLILVSLIYPKLRHSLTLIELLLYEIQSSRIASAMTGPKSA